MAAPTAPKAGINRKFSAIFAAAEMKCMRAEARCCWGHSQKQSDGPKHGVRELRQAQNDQNRISDGVLLPKDKLQRGAAEKHEK